jgi:hypothetical protein
VHINAAAVAPSEEDGSEFTTATLESKRGTITALFNVTMIIAQTFVGLLSGLIIDVAGNITVTITHKCTNSAGAHPAALRVQRINPISHASPSVYSFVVVYAFRSFSICRA